MVLAMLAFALEDMVIKMLSDAIPPWQIILTLGLGGATLCGVAVLRSGTALLPAAALHRAVIIRNCGEVFGTLGFVTALALTPLSSASAILQATPLVVTLGAMVFLREKVGWRRWGAIFVGLFGVLLILRPGFDGFEPASLFAVQGVIGLAIRDLATRRVPKSITSFQLSFLAFALLIPGGLLLAAITGQAAVMPVGVDWVLITIIIVLGVLAYLAIVAATRVGDVSFVTPFRYSRILFALVIGFAVFGERPDAPMLLGAGLIVASGLFTLWRERKHRPAG